MFTELGALLRLLTPRCLELLKHLIFQLGFRCASQTIFLS
ncbi:hypothetical protein NOC27_122 [Nitrosococcus oceani AFC27]|nr:hypothetical protein NOC27_122 [Nitrosococcus oceani AFC27]